MPSARHRVEIDNGLPSIIPQRVNNSIAVTKYYRSANLLVRQANEYRARHNDFQLYAMLMRLASLVVETIPLHKDFNKADPQYQSLRKALLTRHIVELETLKVQLKLKHGTDSSIWADQSKSHSPDTVQLSTSNLPDLDWDNLAQHPSPVGQPERAADSSIPFDGNGQASPAHGTSAQPFSLLDGPQTSHAPPQSFPKLPDVTLPSFQSNLRSASQATKDRHALMPSMASQPSARRRETSDGALYPTFDTSPYAAIDYGQSLNRQKSGQPPPPPPPVEQQMGELRTERASLMDSDAAPWPSYGPTLGPQEIEVQQRVALPGEPDPNGTCCQPQLEPPPAPPEEQPGDISTQKEIREVFVSTGLMEEFLAYARSNTRRGIESCGILAGKLDSKRGLFSITTLIVPKQEGTSDTVQALAEEEIFEAQDSRGLYPMGWIHTHPTQTCFLSSIDVHTQCGYQTMLDEAVAIVMAPSDRKNRCGIFRLSTPGGLKLVQKCQLRGFHMHPSTDTGQPLYELCGHVYINEKLGHDVIDLR